MQFFKSMMITLIIYVRQAAAVLLNLAAASQKTYTLQIFPVSEKQQTTTKPDGKNSGTTGER